MGGGSKGGRRDKIIVNCLDFCLMSFYTFIFGLLAANL